MKVDQHETAEGSRFYDMMPYRYLYCIDMYYSTVSYYKTTGYSMSLSPFVCLHWTKSLTSDSYMYCQCTLQVIQFASRIQVPRGSSTKAVLRLPVPVQYSNQVRRRAAPGAPQRCRGPSVYFDLALVDDAVELKRPGA